MPQAAVAAAQLERVEAIAERRSRLGDLLNDEIAGLAGIERPRVRPGDRRSYWFFMLKVRPEGLRCDRAEFVRAPVAEGMPAAAGSIPVPLYGNPVFQRHGFLAGRWPIQEMGLTAMDYTRVSCPEAEAILETCVRVTIHETMNEGYLGSWAGAIRDGQFPACSSGRRPLG
jgi:dTDP-4-amino-4,6-dideoxygalactose transaminase